MSDNYKLPDQPLATKIIEELTDLSAAKSLLISILFYYDNINETIYIDEFNRNKELQEKIIKYLKIPTEKENIDENSLIDLVGFEKMPKRL